MTSRSSLLFAASLALISVSTTRAGLVWDGGGAADTNINTGLNWDDDVPNALNGTTAATFGTGGTTATINANASFTGITINRDANFTIADGAGALTIGTGGITVTLPTTTARTHAINESSLVLNGNQSWSVTNNTGVARLDVASVISGTGNLTKTGTGLLVLSGNNTYGGTTAVSAGTLRAAHSNALGTGTKNFDMQGGSRVFQLSNNISLPSSITLRVSSNSFDNGGISNLDGSNTIGGNINFTSGNPALNISSASGTLTINGTITKTVTGDTGRTLFLGGASTSQNRTNGVIGQSGAGTSLPVTKQGAGTWVLAGANTYTGATTVNGGTLIAANASALGTGNAVVASGANLSYQPSADTPLVLAGNLTVTAGGTTTLGGAIGSGPTTATIQVAGDATISDANHTIDLFGVPGLTPATGTYTLLSAAGGASSLNPATAPTLGKVINNTNFTVGALSTSATAIQVGITAATPLTTAYWVGGFPTGTLTWAVSDGVSDGNWAATAGGGAQGLVPGASTDVVFSADSVGAAPINTVLGANMTINSLTIADTLDGLSLAADPHTLTIAPIDSATGITMAVGVPPSVIASRVALGSTQTWTNNSVDPLTVSGVISGNADLSKAGTGTVILSASNAYIGETRVLDGTLRLAAANAVSGNITPEAGQLALDNTNALASATLLLNSGETGTVSFDVPADNVYTLGGLVGDRDLDGGGKTLRVGARNQANEYTGILSNAGLTKIGTNTLTLGGDNTFTGNITIDSGRLTLTHSNAAGIGPKTITMPGGGRTLYLENDITLAPDIAIVAASNSGDGGGIFNNSGNNTIAGPVTITFGNPALNISSGSGTLVISGNVTLDATGRPLLLGGASTNDNTISGNISSAPTAGVLPVTKQGLGKWILSGNNTYTGATSVNGGTLAVTGSLGATTVTVAIGATLAGNGNIGGPVIIQNGGKHALEVAATSAAQITRQITGDLTMDAGNLLDLNAATPPAPGVYVLATVTGNINGTPGIISQTGVDGTVTVVDKDLILTVAGTGGFSNWISQSSFGLDLADQGPDLDPDKDGMPNRLEYVLNGNPSVPDNDILPELELTPGDFKFTYQRLDDSLADTTQIFQYGSDLDGWTDLTIPETSGPSGAATIEVIPGTPSDSVKISLPRSLETDGTLFGRLKVVMP